MGTGLCLRRSNALPQVRSKVPSTNLRDKLNKHEDLLESSHAKSDCLTRVCDKVGSSDRLAHLYAHNTVSEGIPRNE